MKKKYHIKHKIDDWNIVIEIDHNFDMSRKPYIDMEDAIQKMVKFWDSWEEDLYEHCGDYTKVLLYNIAKESYIETMKNDRSVKNTIASFNIKEGYTPMDGSYGITILEINKYIAYDISLFDFELTNDTV